MERRQREAVVQVEVQVNQAVARVVRVNRVVARVVREEVRASLQEAQQ